MIKYFEVLENKKNYYLPLINVLDKDIISVYHSVVPATFIENNSEVFSVGKSLIEIYETFDISSWFNNSTIDYGDKCDIAESFTSIKDDGDLYFVKEFVNSIEINNLLINNYLNTIKNMTSIYIDLFPDNKELYSSLNCKIEKALKELENYMTIKIELGRGVFQYQPDSWYITPNNYLYNTGDKLKGHKSRILNNKLYTIYELINKGYCLKNNSESDYYIKKSKEIENNGYITRSDFEEYLNYVNQPIYLEKVNGIIPVSREKHIIEIILGIINAHACLYKFFEALSNKTDNHIEELNKIREWTTDDVGDILVRCCGFHKIESTVDKTITTSLINYEEEFKEYIDKGWTISFVPPIIIDENDHTVKEYPEEFLIIRRILKRCKPK